VTASGLLAALEQGQEVVGVGAVQQETKQQRMLATNQVVSTGAGVLRPQDAIASILASMNQGQQHQMVTVPEQQAHHHQQGVILATSQHNQQIIQSTESTDNSQTLRLQSPDHNQSVRLGTEGQGGSGQPLNLATGSQQIHVQGIKRIAQSSPEGGIVTKKVIIATINGTQRILTPVSSPQMIAVKSNPTRILSDGNTTPSGTPLTIIQQKPVITAPKPKPMIVNSSPPNGSVKSVDNKTCRWKFENGQICGKVFTKTYNLTVHMRMHQDIRPFPCTICEQTFRQKAHLQRHEATHGIDTSQARKKRKRSLLDAMAGGDPSVIGMTDVDRRMSESEEEDNPVSHEREVLYRPYSEEKRHKFSATDMKTEPRGLDLDPMIEPIDGTPTPFQVKNSPITVGTNTEITPDVRDDFVDDLEEDMEPVRYRTSVGTTMQVEQGVQYCESDLLEENPSESKFVPPTTSLTSLDQVAPQVTAIQTQCSISEIMGEVGSQADKSLKIEGGEEVSFSSQNQFIQHDDCEAEYIEHSDGSDTTHLITADGSFIDASTNQIVMTGDGSLVNLVSVQDAEPQDNVVNLVTSTTTNEQGQQIVIIENLDQHSPELQREIMNALLADNTLVPIPQN